MRRLRTALPYIIAPLLTCGLFVEAAQAQESGVVAGTLSCSGRGSIGAIIGSSQRLACTFSPAGGGPTQRYSARITRLGLDVGIKGPSRMIWTVLGPSNGVSRGALEGTFAGVSANASVGVGAGANALVGGFRNSIVLQPLSVQAQTGLNVAAGVAGLRLNYLGR